MRVENYAVAMNAQYYNLQQDHTQVKLLNTTEDFSSDESSDISKVEIDSTQLKALNDELSVELSKAVLENINSQTNRSLRDRLQMSYTYSEQQSLNYQLKAYVQTDDREIELSLDISLSRSFVQKANIEIDTSVLKDPLVLSFDGTMPSLSSKTFSFDIDSDGESDQISRLNADAGFLALDKNENGIIDNGNELFGATSGDGFKDLSHYDDDKNGFIDENDAIFDKLRIWQKNEDKDELIALGEAGIGAIFLGNTSTPFSLKSDSNQSLGEIRSSGFFLFENAQAGIISQIDLAITPQTKESVQALDEMQKNITTLKLESIYAEEKNQDDAPSDKKMKLLQEKIKALEEKLAKAEDENKPPLQAQIGALFAQMMALLETEFT
ncbi:MAG: hypothetical protein U9N33_09675 [Campylobacterota bacterium]|nr:hypothetical protein [Campylobacterota bacterium]